MFVDEETYFQQERVTLHYHGDVTANFNATFPNRWNWWKCGIEFTACYPELTSIDFFSWKYLNDKTYISKLATVDKLTEKIERQCHTIPNEIINNAVQSISLRYWLHVENEVHRTSLYVERAPTSQIPNLFVNALIRKETVFPLNAFAASLNPVLTFALKIFRCAQLCLHLH